MHFSIKNILKNNHNHTPKYTLPLLLLHHLWGRINFIFKIIIVLLFKCYHEVFFICTVKKIEQPRESVTLKKKKLAEANLKFKFKKINQTLFL
jgi:hypothetical protein